MHIIVFSYNRPLQLSLLLDSIKMNLSQNSYEITIIYRSDNDYMEGYDKVIHEHTECVFIRERNRLLDSFAYLPYLIFPTNLYSFIKHRKLRSLKTNFKKSLISVLGKSSRKFIMFCTDDGYFYKNSYVPEDIFSTIQNNSANTSFRMYVGQNINDYPNKCTQVSDDILKWNYYDINNKGHWAHPFSVDSTIYPLEQILNISRKVHFVNPNTYEGAVNSYFLKRRLFAIGLSFKTSSYFCLPVNMVQKVSPNFAGKIDPKLLNDMFLKGYRLVIPEYLEINSKYYLPKKITLVYQEMQFEIETNF